MRLVYPIYYPLFFLLLFLRAGITAYGQDKTSLYVNPVLWASIEAELQQTPPPANFSFIPELVKEHFEQQPDSVYRTHFAVMFRLEQLYNLNAAIYIGEEIARLGREQNNPGREAAAYTHLTRYYDALGAYQLAAMSIEKALAIYKAQDDKNAILLAEYNRLSLRVHFVSRGAIIPRMESLLEQAKANKATQLIEKLHASLLDLTLLDSNYAEAEKHVLYLEKLPHSNPIKPQDYPFMIIAALGRGDMALARNQLSEAERRYLETLRLCRADPSPWFEIYTLHKLTNLELRRGNLSEAKSYLEDARIRAEKLELHDLLTQTYALKSRLAEQENDPAAALRFLKEKILQEEKFKSRSEGFNLESFYLQAERDKLATAEINRVLELDLKNTQLTYSIVILLLLMLLALGLVLGYLRLRQDKAELAHKNYVIQQHADQLESLDAAKSRFFANVSHELRTPLSLIIGPITTLLKEKQASEKQTLLLKAVNRSARQLELLVKDILDLRRLETGKMPLHKEPTDLKAFFQLHLDQFESLAQWRQIQYSTDVRVSSNIVAEIDREKCRQILYNLLSNAFKFTPAQGGIEAVVVLQDEILSLEVADTGPGIPSADLSQIFDRFFQSNQKGRFSAGGSGIGLSLCQDYTRLMGGDIRVESKEDAGCVFYASWPVDFSRQPSALPTPVQVPDLDSHTMESLLPTVSAVGKNTQVPKATILVVEDNPGLREYIGLILSDHYQVLFAENGEAALQQVTSGGTSIDLIMSDLMMPVMDGYQLLENLKSSDATRHLPVIMLTARAEAADRLKALRIGVDDYLTKPFDEEELLVRIANLLKNQAVKSRESPTADTTGEAHPRLSETDQAWLEKFESYIRDNLNSDILSIPALSETFAMSESTLLRQLKRLTGLSPVQYLLEVRLNEARLRLENDLPISISTLASQVGYKDARSFSRSFKKRFGKLPSDLV
ncbi:response regulator [Salmonirosea aquatica]|uniref:histidine kinase n=1 Tax=Salmonirosea aquatica TaxID=2654236 RepID=A0A7C9F5I6_9BACT|nr:response regulator [Cytophagaceae bacterium SJW1-29]